jgi:hypothetical protein
MSGRAQIDKSAAVSQNAAWPNYVAALSACLLGGVVGDRIGQFLYWPIDKVARTANGMEPLPKRFEHAWHEAVALPSDWWLVIVISLVLGLSFSICEAWAVEKKGKTFLILLGVVFLARFLFEGHIPSNGFNDYGVAHYSIYQLGFLIENALICGFAWQAARLGWFLTQERS